MCTAVTAVLGRAHVVGPAMVWTAYSCSAQQASMLSGFAKSLHFCKACQNAPAYVSLTLFRRPAQRLWLKPTRRFQVQTTAAGPAEIYNPYNGTVKHMAKVRTDPETRRRSKSALLVGSSIIQEVTLHQRPKGPYHMRNIFHRENFEIPPDWKADRTASVTADIIKKIVGLNTCLGVQAVAEVEMPQYVDLTRWKPGTLQKLLVLEGVQDPGNLGTLLRTAVGLGWDACLLMGGCCDPFNDKALQAGRGAAFKLPMESSTWQSLKRILKLHKMQCYGAGPDKAGAASTTVSEADAAPESSSEAVADPAMVSGQQPDTSQPLCIILGSEGQGLSQHSIMNSTPLAIPMSGAMESLNVAQAGAILMFALGGRTSEFYSQLE